MKKIIVTLVAMMAVTFCFAGTNSNKVDRRYDMSCNMDRLSEVLALDEKQTDAVETIHNRFNTELQSLAIVRGPLQRHLLHQAVRKDAHHMKRVLNDKQFDLYMRIMLSTLRNRQL
jgi:hypothetical protein